MSETRKDAVSERARMLRAEDELSKAIGALPLPWGDSALDAPLARIREAINALAATPPTPDLAAVREADLRLAFAVNLLRDTSPVGSAFAAMHNEDRAKVTAMLESVALAAVSRPAEARGDDWTPSDVEYDRAIHHNPDAKAWADLFVQTFPRLADKHGLMLGWFANAMMAMHDSMKSRESAAPRPETGEPSEAMVEAAIHAPECEMWTGTNNHDVACCPDCTRNALRSALAAQREPRP